MTIDDLKQLGADTDTGLNRCMNNEAFYLKLVGMALADSNYETLRQEIEAGNREKAFESAHALKGMLGNVSLDNLLKPVVTMTEALRHGEDADYAALLDEMDAELGKLRDL